MHLYGSYTSPFVRHCRIALLQYQAKFKLIETDYQQSAAGSAAMRVPYFEHQDIKLHDSMSIIRFIRELHGHRMCETTAEYDLLLLVNTAIDSTINLFLLEKSGVDIAANSYTQRQSQRIQQCLEHFESVAEQLKWNDAGIRLACYLDWVQYRQRLDLRQYPALIAWLEQAQQYPEFTDTAPPAA